MTMKYFAFIVTLTFLFSFKSIQCQPSFLAEEQEAAYYADIMINATKKAHRLRAEQSFLNTFVNSLNKESSFAFPYDSLIWISKIEPENKEFRLFTWQIMLEMGVMKYNGIIQLKDGKTISLNDNNYIGQDFKYEAFDPENWYGQLYYAMHEYRFEKKNHYLLFGLRELANSSKQKIVEEIIVGEEGVRFGSEIFLKMGARHGENRLMVEFGKVASVSLKYDTNREMIVFDHLTAVINPYERNEMMMVPGGTLEAYEFNKGEWIHLDKIEEEIYNKAPQPDAKSRREKKDLFGNEK